MNEINVMKQYIADKYSAGDAAALDRLSLVLNELLADLTLKRALMAAPEPAPEEELKLEMEERDRLDKELPDPHKAPWRAKP
ncbi:MAG TPA: hypothetical protein VLT56_00150 [Desulfobacterales bacterium]|jgi:hypothetical protein|nr:hypothetical protein [Desulfobacterales bacterium]HSM88410.1 hypothetical protein [Desulfobacterales bacterium]